MVNKEKRVFPSAAGDRELSRPQGTWRLVMAVLEQAHHTEQEVGGRRGWSKATRRRRGGGGGPAGPRGAAGKGDFWDAADPVGNGSGRRPGIL